MLRKMTGFFPQLVSYCGVSAEHRPLPTSRVLFRSPSVSVRRQKQREVLRSDKEIGWGGQNTVSFLSLACEPTHRQSFFFLKRIAVSTGLSSRLGQRQRPGRLRAGGAGGGGRGGQARALAYCRSGLDASTHSFPFN